MNRFTEDDEVRDWISSYPTLWERLKKEILDEYYAHSGEISVRGAQHRVRTRWRNQTGRRCPMRDNMSSAFARIIVKQLPILDGRIQMNASKYDGLFCVEEDDLQGSFIPLWEEGLAA